MSDEVKNAVETVMRGFEEFKATNDARLKEIEKKGSADAVTVAKLAKIEETLSSFETLNQKITAAAMDAKNAKEAADQIEVKFGRLDKGSAKADEKADEVKAAFNSFVRRGEQKLTPDEVKVLTVGDDAQAGYLAPPEYVREIIKASVEISPIRRLARIRTTGNRSIQIPKRTQTSNATWVTEIGARSESQNPAYGLEELTTHELVAEHYVSNAELEDAVFNIEAELAGEFTEQFGRTEGVAFVSGDGQGKPQGFLNGAGLINVNSGNATQITADGLMDLFYGIKSEYSANGTFVLNRLTMSAVRKLKHGDGTYIWVPGIATGVPNTILGAPYVEATDMPNQGAGLRPIAFGDFRRGYTILDRLAMTTMRDPYTRASVGQVKFMARRRVGARVVLGEAIGTLTCAA